MFVYLWCSMQQQGHGNPSGMGGMVRNSSHMFSDTDKYCHLCTLEKRLQSIVLRAPIAPWHRQQTL